MKRFGKAKHIHFVGIGGIGMSGIAELLLNLGYEVSGSDLKESLVTSRLSGLGGRIYSKHNKKHIEGSDVVVYSSAVPESNEELHEARRRHLAVYSYNEYLGKLSTQFNTIAITGTHGKTTTTALAGLALREAGADPSVVISSSTWLYVKSLKLCHFSGYFRMS